MLNEDGRFSFQQQIESIFRSVDFQESVDDEDHEQDPGEDPEIDRGETSFYLNLVVGQNNPVLISLCITPAEERSFWDAWVRFQTSFVEKRGILVQGTISAAVPG